MQLTAPVKDPKPWPAAGAASESSTPNAARAILNRILQAVLSFTHTHSKSVATSKQGKQPKKIRRRRMKKQQSVWHRETMDVGVGGGRRGEEATK